MLFTQYKTASAGNRTRAARVAGEHSTTEPPMPGQRFQRGHFSELHGLHCIYVYFKYNLIPYGLGTIVGVSTTTGCIVCYPPFSIKAG